MNTAQFISIFNSGGNPLGPFQERVAADGGTVEGLDNMLAKYDASASWQLIPSAVKAGTAYAQVPNSSLGDLTVTRASSGTFTNSAGVVQTAASNVLRTDYRNADGTLSATGRYLLEPQRTNSIRNSSMVGAVAGSPGTLPTNWSVTSSGLTRTIVGIGTELGLPYIDIRLNGTANAVFAEIYFDAIISASAAQSWTNVFYSKIITTPTAPNSYILATVVRGSSITIPTQAFTPTYNLSRFSQTITTPTGTTSVQPLVSFGLTVGATYDFTIRIAAPQMELGAYATTWVPTTTAAVTRIADTASKTGVSSLIGQGQGTLYSEFNYRNTTSDPNGRIISVRTATSDVESILVLIFGLGAQANQLQVTTFTGGVSTIAVPASTSTLITFGRHKIAVAYQGTSYVVYLDGVLFATGTGAQPSGMSFVEIGCSALTTRSLSNGISESALFTTRLTNAQLAQLTTL